MRFSSSRLARPRANRLVFPATAPCAYRPANVLQCLLVAAISKGFEGIVERRNAHVAVITLECDTGTLSS